MYLHEYTMRAHQYMGSCKNSHIFNHDNSFVAYLCICLVVYVISYPCIIQYNYDLFSISEVC